MYTKQPKKLLILNILDILHKYSDENHRLSQQDIVDHLKNDYDMSADRKSIRRNILDLIDCGYEIVYSESIRSIPLKGEDGKVAVDPKTGQNLTEDIGVMTDFYLKNKFTDGELRLLIDGLVFSHYVPYNQCKELVGKLEGLSNNYFKSRMKHISRIPKNRSVNRQLFYNIELIDEAISSKKKISFKYTEYGTDKKLHNRKREDGTDRVYVVSPYQMVANEGKYYVICNYDKYEDISHYRIDRIRDISILEDKAKPFEKLEGASGRPLDLDKYMQEHIYMYSSESAAVKFRITNAMISDVIDIFGPNISFYDEGENEVSFRVNTNKLSAIQFAKSYGPDVILLEPKEFADEVRKAMEESLKQYKNS